MKIAYLLDTHAFLWFINNDASMSANTKALIEAPQNDIYLSVASIWEIAIKISQGKLEVPMPLTTFIREELEENNIILLQVEIEHLDIVAKKLPFHHRDPFDRLLVAQALREMLPILSRDTMLDAYNVNRIW